AGGVPTHVGDAGVGTDQLLVGGQGGGRPDQRMTGEGDAPSRRVDVDGGRVPRLEKDGLGVSDGGGHLLPARRGDGGVVDDGERIIPLPVTGEDREIPVVD